MDVKAMWGDRSAAFRYAVYGAVFGLLFPILSTVGDLFLRQLPLTLGNLLLVQGSTPLHWVIDTAPVFLALFAGFAGRQQDQLAMLNRQLRQRVQERDQTLTELRKLRATLVQQVEERTAELTTAMEVGRAAASILDLDTLVQRVVDLVSERFGLYYAGLFLLDGVGEYAVLEAGTGEAGRVMKERRHRLDVGGASMVGAACAQRRARIALDVGSAPVRFDNPLLPDTRSEMALPLMVGDRVLGALDVQSVGAGAFSEGDTAVLQLVADQVAVAVDNARRFSEEAALLEATSPLYRASRRLAQAVTSEEVAQSILDAVAETEADGCAIAQFGYSTPPDEHVETVTFLGTWNRDGDPQFPTGVLLPVSAAQFPLLLTTTFWTVDNTTLVYLPLRAGERNIGFLIVQRAVTGPLPSVLLRFYETLVDQAAVALERARLLEEAQRRATREQALGQMTAHLARSLDLDTVLRTAVRDLGQMLHVDEVSVYVTPPEPSVRIDGGGRDS
jgi:GAF domain-containing protein